MRIGRIQKRRRWPDGDADDAAAAEREKERVKGDLGKWGRIG